MATTAPSQPWIWNSIHHKTTAVETGNDRLFVRNPDPDFFYFETQCESYVAVEVRRIDLSTTDCPLDSMRSKYDQRCLIQWSIR